MRKLLSKVLLESQKREAPVVLVPLSPGDAQAVFFRTSSFLRDSRMLPRCPIIVLIFIFLFPAERVNAAGDPVPVQQNVLKKVGDSAIFRVDIPKGTSFAELFLRTTLKRKAVALWQPGKPLNVLDAKYGGRVTFSEATHSFNISNLRMTDGEIYEVSISSQEPAETVLNTYRLTIFNINGTANKLGNSSCSLDLVCQAGMGPGAVVRYTWKNTELGITLAHGFHLQVIMNPTDKDASYTCTTQASGFQSEWSIIPYEKFCRSGVAGLFMPGFLAYNYFAKALLMPMLVTILMLP